jgi:hypothetical protein
LPDLGVQLLDLALADSLGHISGSRKAARHSFDGLPLPRCDHRMVHAMLGSQLCQRQVAPDRLQRHLRLEIRAVALPRRLHSLRLLLAQEKPTSTAIPYDAYPDGPPSIQWDSEEWKAYYEAMEHKASADNTA